MKEILSDIQVASEYYSISMKFLRKGNNLIGTQSRNRFTPTVTVIIIFGIISMMGDVVYETARSANSQYLNLLTISAAQVGLIFGIGEFLGYFLRLVAGVLSDKSGRYWLL